MDQAEFVDQVSTLVAQHQPGPGDDWPPALFLEFDEGIVGCPLPDNSLASDRAKANLAEAICHAIGLTKPKQMAFVSTVWFAAPPQELVERWRDLKAQGKELPTSERDEGRPSARPDRREGIIVLAMNGYEIEDWIAEIERDESGVPSLDCFMPMHERIGMTAEERAESEHGGTFVDGPQAALREVNPRG